MTPQELEVWKTQIVFSNAENKGLRYRPFCFTEPGVAMLSSILNSETAIRVNIQIIRVFTKMREILSTNKEVLRQIEKIEERLTGHDEDIATIFMYLKKLLNPSQQTNLQKELRNRDELK
jgi:hypothetical protein